MNKKKIVLAASAIALTGALTIGTALAYFTTYSTASGAVTVDLGFTETIPHEEVDEAGKHITIENTGDYDCYVRVKAFAPIDLIYPENPEGWTDGGDGYWYYDEILPAGQTTASELLISYTYPAGDDKPEEFNIVVVQECTPVVLDSEGNPSPNWDNLIEITE